MKWGITILHNPALAAMMAQQGGNAGLGILTGLVENEMQFGLQKKLNKEQIKGSKQMMDYQLMKQLEMWNKTGYGPQMKQLQEAGLNPGLIYGMSGGGGQTTGNISATTQGGQASRANIAQMTGMGIQHQLAQAQIKNIQAQTELTTAQTEKTKGVDTEKGKAETDTLLQGIDNQRQQYQLMKIQERLQQIEAYEKQASQEDRLSYIDYQAQQINKQIEILTNDATISTETKTAKIQIIQQQLVEQVLKNTLLKTQNIKDQAQINQINMDIRKTAQSLTTEWITLNQDQQKITIQKLLQEYTTKYPSYGQVGGHLAQAVVEVMKEVMKGTLKTGIKIPRAE